LEKAQEILAARLQAGKREAATELIYKYYAQIYRFLRRLGYRHHASEDLMQEIFLHAWYHIGELYCIAHMAI
jgi:DNA-directed RNA polymerase specialized sigma24 family protein